MISKGLQTSIYWALRYYGKYNKAFNPYQVSCANPNYTQIYEYIEKVPFKINTNI